MPSDAGNDKDHKAIDPEETVHTPDPTPSAVQNPLYLAFISKKGSVRYPLAAYVEQNRLDAMVLAYPMLHCLLPAMTRNNDMDYKASSRAVTYRTTGIVENEQNLSLIHELNQHRKVGASTHVAQAWVMERRVALAGMASLTNLVHRLDIGHSQTLRAYAQQAATRLNACGTAATTTAGAVRLTQAFKDGEMT